MLKELNHINEKYYCLQNTIQGLEKDVEDNDELGDKVDTEDNTAWNNS